MPQLASIAWLALGAALLATQNRVSISPLPWIALTLLLHASRSTTPGRGAVIVWFAFFISTAISRREIVPIPGGAYYFVAALTAIGLMLPFLIDRLVFGRVGLVVAALVFPAAWVTVDFLQSRFTPNSTWGSLAITQYGNLPLMQIAAYAGLAGITFVIAWFASTFELAWSRGFEWSAVRAPVTTFTAALVAVVVGGAVRVASAPADRRTMRVAMLNRPTDLFIPGEITRIVEGRVAPDNRARVDEQLSRLHDWFLDGSRREARTGAGLVAWPEQSLLVFSENESAFIDRAQRLAAEEHVYLAMGLGIVHLGEPKPFENKLVVIDPSGHSVIAYRKTHPVAGWEE